MLCLFYGSLSYPCCHNVECPWSDCRFVGHVSIYLSTGSRSCLPRKLHQQPQSHRPHTTGKAPRGCLKREGGTDRQHENKENKK